MSHPDLIIGLGSPHGDDAVGWRVVEQLAAGRTVAAAVAALREPSQMLSLLAGRSRVWIVDACRGGALPGTIHRLRWPADCRSDLPLASTHGLGVAEALRLAAALGRLPERVILYAIEIGPAAPGASLSEEAARAASVVAERILKEAEDPPAQAGL